MTIKKPHHTTVAPNAKKLSDDDQKLLLTYPVHTTAEIKSYLKPGEGLDRIGPQVASFLEAHPEIAQSLKLDAATLRAELADATKLDGPAALAYQLYRRGYENAMEKRSDVTRAIYKLNRFAQNADDEELARELADVSEWVSSTHAHNTSPAEDPAPAPTPTAKST